MPTSIEEARKNAECVRFTSDRSHHHSYGESSRATHVRDAFYKTGLVISDQTTPDIARKFSFVCDRLGLPKRAIEAFIFASPEIQAECFSSSLEQCTVRFSSTLINLLDDDEFSFVAGHEIGHFLLGHGVGSVGSDRSVEHFMQLRSQEISVDRLGLIACSDLQIAVRALIKTVSGLDNHHLRFNASKFISQLSNLSDPARGEGLGSTHPSMLIRCRALLWFSMDNDFREYPESIDRQRIDALDNRVMSDLSKYVDGPAEKRIEGSKENLAIWLAASLMVEDGRFERREQEIFRTLFGDEILNKLIRFVSSIDATEVRDAIFERLKASREELEGVIPDSFEASYQEISTRINSKFRRQ